MCKKFERIYVIEMITAKTYRIAYQTMKRMFRRQYIQKGGRPNSVRSWSRIQSFIFFFVKRWLIVILEIHIRKSFSSGNWIPQKSVTKEVTLCSIFIGYISLNISNKASNLIIFFLNFFAVALHKQISKRQGKVAAGAPLVAHLAKVQSKRRTKLCG